jgi:hypothetical protein
MIGYTKLFEQILSSSIWCEDYETRLVWITLLALKDRNHISSASLPGLAHLARVPLESAQRAIDKFLSADPYSRSKANDGRRIEVVEGGWLILNGAAYRSKMDQDERREYNRKKQAEYRNKIKSNPETPPVKCAPPPQAPQTRTAFKIPSLEEVKVLAAKAGIPNEEAEKFFNHYSANGWKVGRNPMRSVGHAISNWAINFRSRAYEPAKAGPSTQTSFQRDLLRKIERVDAADKPPEKPILKFDYEADNKMVVDEFMAQNKIKTQEREGKNENRV